MRMTRTGPLGMACCAVASAAGPGDRPQAHPHVWINCRDDRALRERHLRRRQAQVELRRVLYGDGDRGPRQEQGRQATTARSWPSSPRSTSTASRTSPTSPSRRWPARSSSSASRATTGSSTRTACCRCTSRCRSPAGAGGGQGLDFRGLRSDLLHRLRHRPRPTARLGEGTPKSCKASIGDHAKDKANDAGARRGVRRPSSAPWRQRRQGGVVECNGLMTMSSATIAAPGAGGDAVARHVGACPAGGAPKSPFGAERASRGRAAAEPGSAAGPLQRAQAWVLEKQAQFNRELAAAVRSLKTADPFSATLTAGVPQLRLRRAARGGAGARQGGDLLLCAGRRPHGATRHLAGVPGGA